MPIKNRIAELHAEITEWRRDIHEHPETMYDTERTSKLVADKLREFGCDEVVEGIGRTGVVGVIRGRTDTAGRVVGLRADMDALPILEATGLPYASKTPGKMHACGHDGHTAMLLGAAKYLAETRNFDGTTVVVFQPAEEVAPAVRQWSRMGSSPAGASKKSTACTTCPACRWAVSRFGPGPSTPRPTISPSMSSARAAMPRGRMPVSIPR